MFMPSFRIAGLAALACAVILTACDDAQPVQTPVAPAADNAPLEPKLAVIPRDMVAAVSSGKTAGIISVHFVLDAPPTIGQGLPVRIVIVPHRKFLSVNGHFEGSDGMPVAVGENFGPATDVAAETVLEHTLTLLPSREGVFMVTVNMETVGEEGSVTGIFSIPVIVRPPAAESAAPKDAAPASPAPAAPAAG
jgi:hypothetical protein